MATAVVTTERENYINAEYGVPSWLFTTDHKRIALLYLLSITFFFFIGGAFATMIRIHLLTPTGLLVTPETYNKLFTMHGVAMIFFFLIPSIPAVLGNFLLPIMIGAKDLAFPKINLLSWYIYLVGGGFVLYSFSTGGLDTGWTFYTPLSSVYSNSAVTPAVIGVFINGFSSILTGLNFIVTVHTMRAPGMTWFRLPLFVWAQYATSIIFILGTPVIAITLLLAGMERMFHLGFFNPALGGDPILFQHLFWFYSHPAVYIMILPAMGVISEIIPTFARKPIFGYSFIAGSSIAIAVIGFFVWAHHMFAVGLPLVAGFRTANTRAIVQIEGSAFRVDAGALREILNRSQELDRRLEQSSQMLTMEITQLSACNRLHEVNERLARWLLTCADRIHSDSVPITKEFLSHMLGTRRSSVTVAERMLETAGLISNARGRVDIIDRAKLEQASCDCYRMIRTQRAEWLNESG